MRKPKQAGFTLIEVMIVAAIVGILAAIAYPSYQEHVRQARRAEVATVLLESAQLLERHFTRHGAYDAGTLALASQSPTVGQAVFTLTAVLDEDSYSLTARAVPQGIMAGDVCARYTLNQVGQRTPADIRCWRR
ncbi:type IV pilin protein [Halopseudomonas laoshanensis]|uniref:Type IV pilin protein n=1 Tax=Halopseudomonas laoshanensis TaxID=2268758 RepID=A0A7V7KUE7_9GAMM|nr:type IV pilin protein [Halopseudomonas laoshanensis]KAA0692397.1 type IV pilin protein [Halopseudomonas laoshanensis]